MVCRGFWTHSSVCARVNERGTANSFSSLSEGIKKKKTSGPFQKFTSQPPRPADESLSDLSILPWLRPIDGSVLPEVSRKSSNWNVSAESSWSCLSQRMEWMILAQASRICASPFYFIFIYYYFFFEIIKTFHFPFVTTHPTITNKKIVLKERETRERERDEHKKMMVSP